MIGTDGIGAVLHHIILQKNKILHLGFTVVVLKAPLEYYQGGNFRAKLMSWPGSHLVSTLQYLIINEIPQRIIILLLFFIQNVRKKKKRTHTYPHTLSPTQIDVVL